MDVDIIGFGLEDKKNIKKFAMFPWKHYKKDSLYVPQLTGELLGNKLLSMKGIFTADHPYHENVKVHHWLAYKNGKIAGRVSGALNHEYNKAHKTKLANFGFFESIHDEEVSKALLDSVCNWAREQNMDTVRGPGAYSNITHEPYQGCLIDNFHDAPCLEMPYHYPYYAALYEKYGFKKAKDYYAVEMSRHAPFIERENRLMQLIKKRHKMETRTLNMNNVQEEVQTIVRLYNDAWVDNWGFLPIKDSEADALADILRLIAVPELIRFAIIDGKEIAVVGFLPDLHEKLARKKSIFGNSDLVRVARMYLGKKNIERYRFMFLGVDLKYRHTGADSLLAFELRSNIGSIRPKAKRVEASLLLEDNYAILNLAAKRGMGHIYKTYRIYDFQL
ncbi:MAG: hypothetical protein ABUK01_09730 [Leptospirales bacterium]